MMEIADKQLPGAEQLLIRRYPDGGVVVNLESGNVYRVNLTAAVVCEALIQGERPDLRVAESLGISPIEAAPLVDQVVSGLTALPVRSSPPGAYHFLSADDGYIIQDGEHKVLSIDEEGLRVRVTGDAVDPDRLELYVRALAPKLLSRQGVSVLHASSCLTPEGSLIVFAGLSGAGKTTTARAFGAGSFRLVSEDLVALTDKAAGPHAAMDAERRIHDWARGVAGQLLARPSGVAVGDLTHLADGPAAPVREVLFVDRDRRRGDEFATSPLAEADALVALLPHYFLGAREVDAWRRHLALAGALVASTPMAELWSPLGIDRLPAAAAAYSTKRAS